MAAKDVLVHDSVLLNGCFCLVYDEESVSLIDLTTLVEIGDPVSYSKKYDMQNTEVFTDKGLTLLLSSEIAIYNTITIYTNNEENYNLFKTTFEKIQPVIKKLRNPSIRQLISRLYFKLECMLRQSKQITTKALLQEFCLSKLEDDVASYMIKQKLITERNDAQINTDAFNYKTFYNLYKYICPRTDLDIIISESFFNKKNLLMDPNKILEFIMSNQFPTYSSTVNIDLEKDAARKFYQTCLDQYFYVNIPNMRRHLIDSSNFLDFITSDTELAENSNDHITHDMDFPLSYYYINSSHNTYLTAWQVYGKSSVEMYRQVLIAGCRCVELDCWDGPNNEPMITHGFAFCTNISLKDVLETIKKYAFSASEYPLILSFENHCSLRQQVVIAKQLKSILGDYLLDECLENHPLKDNVRFPSPNQLKYKILVKNNKFNRINNTTTINEESEENLDMSELPHTDSTPESLTTTNIALNTNNSTIDMEKIVKNEKSNFATLRISNVDRSSEVKRNLDDIIMNITNFAEDEMDEQVIPRASSCAKDASLVRKPFQRQAQLQDANVAAAKKQQLNVLRENIKFNYQIMTEQPDAKKMTPEQLRNNKALQLKAVENKNVHPMLSKLVNYMIPMPLTSPEEFEKSQYYMIVSSLNESNAINMIRKSPHAFFLHNKEHITRIYPKSSRVESTNFDPVAYWNCGCQMVALNFQTPDIAMQLNTAKFRMNGNSGYLLKPMAMINSAFDPLSSEPFTNVIPLTVTIKLISGQFLTEKRTSCTAYVEFYGLDNDSATFRAKAVPVQGTSGNVCVHFKGAEFTLDRLILSEITIVRFSVYDDLTSTVNTNVNSSACATAIRKKTMNIAANDVHATGQLLGQRTMMLEKLECGFRHIPLQTASNVQMPLSSLFVHVKINHYVSENMGAWANFLENPALVNNMNPTNNHPYGQHPSTSGGEVRNKLIPFFNGTKQSGSTTNISNSNFSGLFSKESSMGNFLKFAQPIDNYSLFSINKSDNSVAVPKQKSKDALDKLGLDVLNLDNMENTEEVIKYFSQQYDITLQSLKNEMSIYNAVTYSEVNDIIRTIKQTTRLKELRVKHFKQRNTVETVQKSSTSSVSKISDSVDNEDILGTYMLNEEDRSNKDKIEICKKKHALFNLRIKHYREEMVEIKAYLHKSNLQKIKDMEQLQQKDLSSLTKKQNGQYLKAGRSKTVFIDDNRSKKSEAVSNFKFSVETQTSRAESTSGDTAGSIGRKSSKDRAEEINAKFLLKKQLYAQFYKEKSWVIAKFQEIIEKLKERINREELIANQILFDDFNRFQNNLINLKTRNV